jgi:uncharacterized protein YyaL (SSP411 family)
MPAVLARVAEAFRTRREELAAPSSSPEAPPPVGGTSRDITAHIFDTFDEDHGGFGTETKFPLVAPLELALDLYRESQDPAMAHIVEATLDAVGWGGLYDEVDGGFFRCAAERNWTRPHQEKLLDVNASLLRMYVEASETLRIARYRERAADVLRYVQTWLADPVDGGWSGSQQADRAYYAGTLEERQARTPPNVDGVLYAAWNAQMVSATLRAAELLDDTALGEFALKSLERINVACYSPGAGVAHCLDGRPSVRGLLDDQVSMAAAHLDAHAATGNIVYEMMAQELMHYAVRMMWDEEGGGFFDRSVPEAAERVGLMRDRLKPFVANCDAARVLKRLAAVKGDHNFGGQAEATLTAMAPLAAQQGPVAAHYVLALRQPIG